MNKVSFNYKEFYTLTRKQEKNLINQMEQDILNRKKVYDLQYFQALIDWQIGRQSQNDTEFDDYLKYEYLIKKLKWLREKNIRLQYSIEQNMLYEKLKAALPEGNLKDLENFMDSFSDMEAELSHV